MASGAFICLVGIDGSGKSSILQKMVRAIDGAVLVEWQQFQDLTRIPTLPQNLTTTVFPPSRLTASDSIIPRRSG